MKLYEYEAKDLLRAEGVVTPAGTLHKDSHELPSDGYPLVAKAQVLEGGRGKRGGILVVNSQADLAAAVERLLVGSDLLPKAATVLVEQFVVASRELYVALSVDRDLGTPVLLVSARGGINVEDVPEEDLYRFPLSILDAEVPLVVIEAIATELTLNADGPLGGVLQAMWTCFCKSECLLVEINPLIVSNGELVAADAKVVIDDDARRRPTGIDDGRDKTSFEVACAAAGVTATELSGDVAIITSGAGLAMATLDAVVRLGGRACCVVDMGYSTLQSQSTLQEVAELVYGLAPRAILINAFLQMASCRTLAAAMEAAVRHGSWRMPVVARLTGNDAEGVEALLSSIGVVVAEGTEAACVDAVRLAAAG